MSHPPHKYIDDNECSGPRPPVPGEESRVKKMTEGVSESSKSSSPSYLNWARTLTNLLEDRDGVELFKRYVEEEASMYNDHLNFYFACEGLKQQTDPEKVKQIIAAIYRFLRKSRLTITEDLRKTIKAGLKNEIPLNPNIYDSLQLSTLITIREKIYGSFLTSEMYIKYIQQMSAAQERCDGNISMVNVASGSGFGGSSSAGGLYGPSTSASSSGSGSATETLPRSSTLPTLHEDTELSICDDFDSLRVSEGRLPTEMPLRLTEDLLRATQKRRLEIRPPGAHGYVYTANTSYNPNSRVDSERQSCSSGGRTDSDKVSLSSCSLDGRPYPQKRHSTTESKAMRQNALANKETNNFQVIPRTQRLHSNEHQFKEDQFILLLMPKLEEVKRKQDLEERTKLERSQEESTAATDRACLMTTQVSDRALADAIRQKFALDDGNDQDILDQHVSRVWKDQTPHRSPGTISPCLQQTRRRTTTHDSGMLSDGTLSISGHSMRHSKSMPENSSSSRKITNKWPSMNTDSGISLFSADTLMKYKDTSLRSGSSTAFQLEEAKRRLEDETRRSRRHSQHPPPLPMPSMSSSSSGSSTMQQPPPLPARPQETTTVVFSFCDEEFPYRTKIPGTQPTLKQFKDYLPKKGNFRFFFKTHCEDPESPVIQEEIANDSDILPLFEGKVMGLVKPSD